MKSGSAFFKPFCIALIFILIVPVWMFWRGYTEDLDFKMRMTEFEADFLIAATVVGAWAHYRKLQWTWRSAFISFILVMVLVPAIFLLCVYTFLPF